MATLEHPTSLAARALAAADPRDRLRAITTLRDELDELEADAVRGAIRSGASWSQVAQALGISKQSAHRRHAKKLDGPPSMLRVEAAPRSRERERIVVTAQARAAVRAARAAARVLNHREVDPGHLLLGLMADPRGVAAAALGAIGVDFDAARDAVGRVGRRATTPVGGSPPDDHVPIGYLARGVLEQSLREAQRLGHEHLGAEHLLLGLLRNGTSIAARVLADVGVSSEDVERCLGKVLMEAPFSPR